MFSFNSFLEVATECRQVSKDFNVSNEEGELFHAIILFLILNKLMSGLIVFSCGLSEYATEFLLYLLTINTCIDA